MKKLLYTLLAVSVIFSACKKEESEEGGLNPFGPLIGLWDYDYYEYEGYINLVPNSVQYEFLNSGNLNITENGTAIFSYPYTYTDTKISITTEETASGGYTVVVLTYDISASNNMLQIFNPGNNGEMIQNFSRH